MGRFSSSFTPIILSASNSMGINPLLITVIFLGICAAISIKLPETKDRPMKDYLAEESGDPFRNNIRVSMIHMTARCGSTLLGIISKFDYIGDLYGDK